jgi:transposase-like protein
LTGATRWVFVQLKANKTTASAQAFLKALHKACPLRITKLLTDNGKSSRTGYLPAGSVSPAATMSSINCARNWA